MLVVFTEATRAAEPGEGAFNDPAPRQYLEPVDALVVLDDFQTSTTAWPEGTYPLDKRASIAPVRPDAPQPAEAFP